MLHIISAGCVACDLHTIAPRPLEHTCWRQFAVQRGNSKNLKLHLLMRLLFFFFFFFFFFYTVKRERVCG